MVSPWKALTWPTTAAQPGVAVILDPAGQSARTRTRSPAAMGGADDWARAPWGMSAMADRTRAAVASADEAGMSYLRMVGGRTSFRSHDPTTAWPSRPLGASPDRPLRRPAAVNRPNVASGARAGNRAPGRILSDSHASWGEGGCVKRGGKSIKLLPRKGLMAGIARPRYCP